GIVVHWLSRWRPGRESLRAQSRRGSLGDGLSCAGRIVAKAPGSCTSALKTNPACYYHPFEYATNATRRGGRSGVVSPWPDCDERRHIASKRHLGGEIGRASCRERVWMWEGGM